MQEVRGGGGEEKKLDSSELTRSGSCVKNLYPTMCVLLKAGLPKLGSVDALGDGGGVCEFPQLVGSTLHMSLYAFFWVHRSREVCVQDCERFKWKGQSCKEMALEKHTTPSPHTPQFPFLSSDGLRR